MISPLPNYSIFNDISSRLKIIDEDTYNGVVFSNSEEKERMH
ncbi:WSSV100 [White spot syndrome virus]|uniref:WSSV100 n=1 Tax=White spot syndrome virus TaxID=342409 RepID=A0A2I6SBL8_9VIRU|nr:WSSV100 [White spot syndrome virus]